MKRYSTWSVFGHHSVSSDDCDEGVGEIEDDDNEADNDGDAEAAPELLNLNLSDRGLGQFAQPMNQEDVQYYLI